jgi:gamma-glutamyltranspeptidase/glutathione hydrolase
MLFGSPGGDVQCQAMLQFFLNVTMFGMDPQEAIESPRFFSASFPNSFYPHTRESGVLRIEEALAPAAARLTEKGHRVELWPNLHWRAGGVCGIVIDHSTGDRVAGADPRRECYALAW